LAACEKMYGSSKSPLYTLHVYIQDCDPIKSLFVERKLYEKRFVANNGLSEYWLKVLSVYLCGHTYLKVLLRFILQ